MPTKAIYTITHIPTGKVYVGGSADAKTRWIGHQSRLRCGKHEAKPLLEMFWLDGFNGLRFDIVRELSDDEDLRDAEQALIDELDACNPEKGFNTHLDARGPRGIKRKAITRKRIAKALRGKEFTAERCQNISLGRKGSERAKAAIAVTNAAKRVLMDNEVLQIIAEREQGLAAQKIADKHHVSRRVVRAILAGETYSDVTGIACPT